MNWPYKAVSCATKEISGTGTEEPNNMEGLANGTHF
jgi:hypothetical protein